MSALRVMVVDGDRATRELLRASLTRAGYAARTSAEAGEAIETLRRESISLGVASVIPGSGSSAELVKIADRAVYLAKAQGRNRSARTPVTIADYAHAQA